MREAQYYINQLQLQSHPEGGYYKSSLRSDELMLTKQGERPIYTSIYFLLGSDDISHLHRIQSDEVWYFHAGDTLTIHLLYPDGRYEAKKLGLNLAAGEQLQIVVPKHTIFGASVEVENTFSLVGCMVAPGFDFADFELFTQEELSRIYPQHETIIQKMAYEKLP